MTLFFSTLSSTLSSLQIVEVYLANHLSPDGSLDVSAILKTLAKLYQSKMASSLASDPAPFVTRHLLQAFKHAHHRIETALSGLEIFHPWITKQLFWQHLSDLHDETAELPEPTLLQHFQNVAKKLQAKNFALIHYKYGFSSVNIVFVVNRSSGKLYWRWKPEHFYAKHAQERKANNASIPAVETFAIRFPYFRPLFEVMESFFKRQVPMEFWLHGKQTLGPFSKQSSDTLFHSHLLEAIALIEKELSGNTWNLISNAAKSASSTEVMIWLWLLEEWLLAYKLASNFVANSNNYAWSEFPIALQCDGTQIEATLEWIGARQEPVDLEELKRTLDCDVVQVQVQAQWL